MFFWHAIVTALPPMCSDDSEQKETRKTTKAGVSRYRGIRSSASRMPSCRSHTPWLPKSISQNPFERITDAIGARMTETPGFIKCFFQYGGRFAVLLPP